MSQYSCDGHGRKRESLQDDRRLAKTDLSKRKVLVGPPPFCFFTKVMRRAWHEQVPPCMPSHEVSMDCCGDE